MKDIEGRLASVCKISLDPKSRAREQIREIGCCALSVQAPDTVSEDELFETHFCYVRYHHTHTHRYIYIYTYIYTHIYIYIDCIKEKLNLKTGYLPKIH